MPSLLQIVSGTPIWVWVLLAYLLWVGIRALQPSTAPLWAIAIMPTVFFVWGIYGLYDMHGFGLERTMPWVGALAAGTGIGIGLAGRQPIRADKVRRLIRTAGGSLTLVLIILIFSTKYVYGYLHAVEPVRFAEPQFWLSEVIVSGVLSGMFIGRFAGLWRQYQAAPHEDLAA